MAEKNEGTEGKVRRFWEEELGMDLSHLSGEDLRDFGERQARVETVDDLLGWDLTKAVEKAEAEHWETWREKLALHLGISRGALDTAENKVNAEMGQEALSRFKDERGDEGKMMKAEKKTELLPPEECQRQARGFIGGVRAVEAFVGRELKRDAYHGHLTGEPRRSQAHLDEWVFFYLDSLLGVETEEGERLMRDPALRERLKRVFVDELCRHDETSCGGDWEEIRASMMEMLS